MTALGSEFASPVISAAIEPIVVKLTRRDTTAKRKKTEVSTFRWEGALCRWWDIVLLLSESKTINGPLMWNPWF
jgi:hypothetical protein